MVTIGDPTMVGYMGDLSLPPLLSLGWQGRMADDVRYIYPPCSECVM